MNKEELIEANRTRGWILYAVLTALGTLMFYFLFTLFIAIAHSITWVGAALIYTIALYFIMLEGCRIAVFPGSSWLWKRSLEMNRAR